MTCDDEDADDEDYTEHEDYYEYSGQEGMMDEGCTESAMDEEHKDGDNNSSDSDEDQDLQECCEPESNALQELEAETKENFNL